MDASLYKEIEPVTDLRSLKKGKNNYMDNAKLDYQLYSVRLELIINLTLAPHHDSINFTCINLP